MVSEGNVRKFFTIRKRVVVLSKIKWGILGTASIAEGCTIPGMRKAKGCELYAIAGRNEEKTKRFQKEYGFTKAYVGY